MVRLVAAALLGFVLALILASNVVMEQTMAAARELQQAKVNLVAEQQARATEQAERLEERLQLLAMLAELNERCNVGTTLRASR